MNSLLVNLATLATLLPASLQAFRRAPAADRLFWAFLGIAATGAAARVAYQIAGPWPTDLATALWLTIAGSLALYAVTAAVVAEAWRLAPLIAAYMLLLGILGTVLQDAPGRPLVVNAADTGWMTVHIVVSIATYGLVTIAAVAALAAYLQERALKRKRPTALTRLLPSVAASDALVFRLLAWGEGVLLVGLVTGMALDYRTQGRLLVFDHKTVLTLSAFAVIGALLVAHHVSGLRGRQAARVVLVAYLLMTLGYPGVKFVSGVLMA